MVEKDVLMYELKVTRPFIYDELGVRICCNSWTAIACLNPSPELKTQTGDGK